MVLTRGAIIVAAVATLAGTAIADDRKLAEAHARRGVALYNLGKYEAAIAEFEAAYTLYQSDALLFDLGQAHRQLDHCEPALHYYRRFLANRPDSELAADVRKLVPKLEAACAAKRERPDGAEADAPTAIELPPPPASGSASGSASATASATDHRYRSPLPTTATATDPETTSATDTAPDPAGPPPRTLRILAAATGGVLLASRAAPTAGITASVTLPRVFISLPYTLSVAADLRVLAWSDGINAGASPAASLTLQLARHYHAVRGSPLSLDAGFAAGILYLADLDARGHPLGGRTTGSSTQVLPGGRLEIGFARRVSPTSRVELYTCARVGAWPALGSVRGSVVLELDAIAGIRVRP